MDITSRAIPFISRHAGRPIRVDALARAARTSRRTLEQRFRQHVGHSVAAEIRGVRLDRAGRWLAGTEMTMSRIAQCAGFSSAHQLPRVFRREFNQSPWEYRRRLGSDSATNDQ